MISYYGWKPSQDLKQFCQFLVFSDKLINNYQDIILIILTFFIIICITFIYYLLNPNLYKFMFLPKAVLSLCSPILCTLPANLPASLVSDLTPAAVVTRRTSTS